MWWRLLIFLLVLLPVRAQEETPPKPRLKLNGVTYVEEAAPTDDLPLNKNVLFLLDCSGSMGVHQLEEAFEFMQGITKHPIDEMQVAVLGFNEINPTRGKLGLFRWPGIPKKGVPEGWASLPSMTILKKIEKWLDDLLEQRKGAGTRVITGLEKALTENRKDLSIILVTDGIFQQESTEEIIKAIETFKEARNKAGLAPVQIMIYQVKSESYVVDPYAILTEIAPACAGGYYHKDD